MRHFIKSELNTFSFINCYKDNRLELLRVVFHCQKSTFWYIRL